MNGMSMVFRVALSLIADHKDMLLQCRNFEQLMDYFKTTLPSMGASQFERVIREVGNYFFFFFSISPLHFLITLVPSIPSALLTFPGAGVGHFTAAGGL
jgi:hypothetical protein